MKRLDGKRILLIAPRFFGYEREIISEIESRGGVVDWLPDRPFDTPVMAAVTRLRASWVLPFVDLFYERLLSKMNSSHYDIVLVVNGQTLSKKMIRSLRINFSSAKFILYMWDSMENKRGVVGNLPFFDAAYSFDPKSANDYGMRLRPLFFTKGFERPPSKEFEHDLSFIGTVHSDRYAVISQLRLTLPPEIRSYWYLFLQAPWVYQAYRIGKPEMRSAKQEEFQFVPLAKSKLQSVFANSNAIVDIEHPRQRGLTMRTFETMGSHKKLITTNANVRDYDFFNQTNICVINRKSPHVPKLFLESVFSPIEANLYQRYSIEGWLDEVLDLRA